VSWKGTLVLLILAIAALVIFFSSGRSRSRSVTQSLLDIHPEEVSQINIHEGGGEIILHRNHGIWAVESRLLAGSDRADASMIRSLLEQSAGITSLDILRPSELKGTVSLESLDLKTPKRSLSFLGRTSRSIDFGSEGASKGQLYARLDGDKSIYLIPSDVLQTAFHPAEEFRDHRLTSLDAERLEEITLTKGAPLQTLSLRKSDSGWKLTSPLTARGNDNAVTTWAASLLSAKVDHWMPAGTDPTVGGMDAPFAVISWRETGSTSPVTMNIGSTVPGSPESRFVRCSDRPGICVVQRLSRALEVTPSSLRSRQPKPLRLDSVDRIEIHPAQQAVAVAIPMVISRKKGSDDWKIIGGGTETLPGSKVDSWFQKLQSLTASSFEAATPLKLESTGLTHPAVIRLIAHLSENTAEESAGDLVLAEYSFGTAKDGVLAFREGDSTDLMIVPETAVDLTKGPGSEK